MIGQEMIWADPAELPVGSAPTNGHPPPMIKGRGPGEIPKFFYKNRAGGASSRLGAQIVKNRKIFTLISFSDFRDFLKFS